MQAASVLGHRAPLLWLVLPLAAGIGAAHASSSPVSTVALMGGCGVALGTALATRSRWPQLSVAALVGALMAVGALHHETHRSRLPDWNLLPSREVELTVRVHRPFQTDDLDERVSVIGTVKSAPSHLQDLIGQALHVRVWRYHNPVPVLRGGLITVRGQIEPLPRQAAADDPDGFVAYLIDSGLNFRLSRGRLLDAQAPVSAYARWRAAWQHRLGERLPSGLSEHPALAGALTAMVMGDRRALEDDSKDLFLRSGTMHLFAISGLHIGVIALGLNTMLRLARLGPAAAMLVGGAFLGFYVDLIGQPPSAVRAWLMVTCFQFARVVRSRGNAVSAISGSALLVLLLDPMQLFSAGFQMSYGIVMALLFYGLPLGEAWKQRFELWTFLPEADLSKNQRRIRFVWDKVLTSAAMAWAATLVGLIAGIAFFGWFSPFALLANLVLIPLACIAIKCGFLALLAAAAGFTWVVLLFNHAAALVLLIMQEMLATGMSLPGTAWPAGFAHPLWGPVSMCLILASMAWGYTQSWEGRWARPWHPGALTLLVLVSGMRLV